MKQVGVTGSFDNLRSHHVRFLQETSRLGEVYVLLWSDEIVRSLEGSAPKFPQAERLYFVQAIRYVKQVILVTERFVGHLPHVNGLQPEVWVVEAAADNQQKRAYSAAHNLTYTLLKPQDLQGFPASSIDGAADPTRKKVVVTGCYDWLHSGHVRFFEETSGLGDLYVVVGSDANIRLLKGEDHPLFPQDERQYMVQAIHYVKQALISTGHGWMDAEPEIDRIKPDMYVVNEDGDVPEKRAFCDMHNLEYVVLKRIPAEVSGRESTTTRLQYQIS
jgi:cytidyltransferase-like protein